MYTPEFIKSVENKTLNHKVSKELSKLNISRKNFNDLLVQTYKHNDNIFKFVTVSDEKTYKNKSLQIYNNRKISELLDDIDDDLVYYRFHTQSEVIKNEDIIDYLKFILTGITIKQSEKYNDLEILSVLITNFTDDFKFNKIFDIVSKRVDFIVKGIDQQDVLRVNDLNITIN